MTSPRPAYGYDDLLHDIVKGIATALGDRPDESAARNSARTAMIAHMVMAYLPRDGVETMLAGLCVSYHHLVLDAMREALIGQLDTIKPRTRGSIVSIGNLLLRTMKEFRVRQHEAAARERLAPYTPAPAARQPEPAQRPAVEPRVEIPVKPPMEPRVEPRVEPLVEPSMEPRVEPRVEPETAVPLAASAPATTPDSVLSPVESSPAALWDDGPEHAQAGPPPAWHETAPPGIDAFPPVPPGGGALAESVHTRGDG